MRNEMFTSVIVRKVQERKVQNKYKTSTARMVAFGANCDNFKLWFHILQLQMI